MTLRVRLIEIWTPVFTDQTCGMWDEEHISEAPGAVEKASDRERDPQHPLATPELGKPTLVGLLSVPAWSKEIRLRLMNRAMGTITGPAIPGSHAQNMVAV